MKLVIIESPYAGDVEANTEYARRCLYDSLQRGEAPFASHLLYTQVLFDAKPEERRLGMDAGFAWAAMADICAVYTDLGITPGMHKGIASAKKYNILVECRRING